MAPVVAQDSTNGGVASVGRALTLLEVISGQENGISLAELASRTGYYKSTILRLLGTLMNFGLISRRADGQYTLGAKTLELGNRYQHGFRLGDIVNPVLETLAAETGESVSFYVEENGYRVVLLRKESYKPIMHSVKLGHRLPLNKGAGGIILKRFQNGIGSAPPAASEMLVSSFGERTPDAAAIAAPVFQVDGGLVGALGISGPRSRFTKKFLRGIEKRLLESSVGLSIELGCPRHLLPFLNAKYELSS